MPPRPAISELKRRFPFYLFLAVVAASAFLGGTSRVDTVWLLALRLFCCLAIPLALLWPAPERPARKLDVPLLFLAALAVAIGIQLIPLPPAIWTALPGHAHFAQAAELAGFPQPWRPISLTPWLTWNSLLTLLPITAALLCLARMDARFEDRLVIVYLCVLAVNLLFGVLQVAGLMDGPPLRYRFIHKDSAIGFFTNRNHAAVLLATGFPVLRLWVELARNDAERWKQRAILAAIAGLGMVPVIMATGSRSGMTVALVAIAIALGMAPLTPLSKRSAGGFPFLRIALCAVPFLLAGVIALSGKARSLNRIIGNNVLEERRLELLPTNLRLLREFFPFGSGFGSFDPVFRVHEPDSALALSYFNHAHNDVLELLITGGLPAFALFALLAGWIVWRVLPSRHAGSVREALYARTGAIVIALWFAGSLTDYPLRVPFADVMLAFALFWLCPRATTDDASGKRR